MADGHLSFRDRVEIRFKAKRVCCVISGGNADPALYAELIEGI